MDMGVGDLIYIQRDPQQDPWIQNATLRDNVLMGLPLDHARYERVLDVCALRADLQTLPGGKG